MIRNHIPCAVAAIAILAGSLPVYAVSLEEKATDNSVCNFGNDSTDLVYRKLLNGVHGNPSVFTNAMRKWIAKNCANGQTLLIGDDENKSLKKDRMEEVANSACQAADVTWQNIGERGFRLRCTITKLDELKLKYGGDDGK
ncbi:MAG: hypothetical protein V4568_01870 [Pseudomonadota bacterium]